jgi:beta-glucanase (GH16 family)
MNILGGTNSVENYGSVKLTIGENYYEKFHNFGMEWTDNYIKFYIDGKCRFTFDATTDPNFDVFDQYANVCLCFFADEEWCKVPLADGDNENCSYVDWIRVWQKDESGYGIKIK